MTVVQAIRSHLRGLSHPLATKYNLELLPLSADVLVISALFFFAVHRLLSPAISRALFPTAYGRANKKIRNNWYMVFEILRSQIDTRHRQGRSCRVSRPCLTNRCTFWTIPECSGLG